MKTKNNDSAARRARSFRLVCEDHEIPLVEELLAAQGFAFASETFSPQCRILEAEPFALGGSVANRFGLLYIQDRSSMLPPLLLAPEKGAAVLDMCASPGGKTGFLAQLVGPGGFVLGNEPSPDRLDTLRQNLFRHNLLHAATCGYADLAPVLPPESFDHILLDPPCSGWGTAEKNPNVMRIWREDKVAPLIALQKRLLETAVSLLKPGGGLMYSTCTTNQAENEDQTAWALDNLPLDLSPLPGVPGFEFEPPRRDNLEGVLRVDAEKSEAQGFYLSRFVKQGAPSIQDHDAFTLPGETLDPARLKDGGGLLWDALPPGKIARFKERCFFLHQKAAGRIPESARWQGYFLGTLKKDSFKPHPRQRRLLPSFETAGGVNAAEPSEITALLSGQSVTLESLPIHPGLYYKGLPLGRLTRKGARALWSDR